MLYPCLGRSKGSHHADRFQEDGKTWELQRHVSFVDCPGHDILMATMLNGAAVSGEHYDDPEYFERNNNICHLLYVVV